MKIVLLQSGGTSRRRFMSPGDILISAVLILVFVVNNLSQQPVSAPDVFSPAEIVADDGLTVEMLIELSRDRRNDLLAARQRLNIAKGKLLQAGLRPNPTLDAEIGSPKFIGGDSESNFSVGVSQVFEMGAKRSKRVALAELEMQQIRAEVMALESQAAVEIRTIYINTLAAARQLDILEKLIAGDLESVRASEERLKEGDVAPLEVNLFTVEADRLKLQAIAAKRDLETQFLQLKTLIGANLADSIRIAPQPERPPRLDLGLSELTEHALRNRADLQAVKLAEELGNARIELAKANAVPNISGSVQYSRNKQIFDFPAAVGGNLLKRDGELSFGISIEIPVFNRNQGEISSAASQVIQAVRQREFLESTIRRDVAIAYRRYRAAAEQLVIFTTQILPRSEENLRSVRAAFGFGEFSVFEVVNEQRRMTENISGYNQVLRDYYAALADLEAALGTAIPATGLSSATDSILPDKDLLPGQFDRLRNSESTEKVMLLKAAELKKKQ